LSLFCRPFGPVCFIREVPGAARFALAPGYLMPRLRRSTLNLDGGANGAPNAHGGPTPTTPPRQRRAPNAHGAPTPTAPNAHGAATPTAPNAHGAATPTAPPRQRRAPTSTALPHHRRAPTSTAPQRQRRLPVPAQGWSLRQPWDPPSSMYNAERRSLKRASQRLQHW
jgi:hypothetical protein